MVVNSHCRFESLIRTGGGKMNGRDLAALLALALLLPGAAFAEDKKDREPTAEEALKQKVKAYEEKLAEMRAAMLKEFDDAIKKADEAVKNAQKDLTDARGDGEALRKALAALQKAQQERNQLTRLRLGIEHRIHAPPKVDVKLRRPLPPEEQRLGILPTRPAPALSKQLGLKKDEGAVVETVTANSPAAKAGVQQYDVLVKIDGKPVPASMTAFRKLLAGMKTDRKSLV